ncbi:hypothetical protein OHB11_00690 [Streptomyces zaomyceticus]|uniref:hypothetical protein n=1 Tax=Streptomyces zaomyceticus TaxID=68286 RepID=UPI0032473ED9
MTANRRADTTAAASPQGLSARLDIDLLAEQEDAMSAHSTTKHQLRRAIRSVALAAAAGTLTLALPGAARAGAAAPSCGYTVPWGAVRVWEHPGFTGGYRDFYGNDLDWTNNTFNNGVRLDDAMSSALNCGTGSTYHIVQFNEHPSFSGQYLCLWPGNSVNNFGDYGWQDRVSGHRWSSDCPR